MMVAGKSLVPADELCIKIGLQPWACSYGPFGAPALSLKRTISYAVCLILQLLQLLNSFFLPSIVTFSPQTPFYSSNEPIYSS